jgi:hypothetical protein
MSYAEQKAGCGGPGLVEDFPKACSHAQKDLFAVFPA